MMSIYRNRPELENRGGVYPSHLRHLGKLMLLPWLTSGLPSRVPQMYLGSCWDSLAVLTFRFRPAFVSMGGTIRCSRLIDWR